MLKKIVIQVALGTLLLFVGCVAPDKGAHSSIFKSKILSIEQQEYVEDGNSYIIQDITVVVLEGP